jgi:Na+-transporting methylmalonyl-CoA/oxaloacetate decarboxylase gamma subunit
VGQGAAKSSATNDGDAIVGDRNTIGNFDRNPNKDDGRIRGKKSHSLGREKVVGESLKSDFEGSLQSSKQFAKPALVTASTSTVDAISESPIKNEPLLTVTNSPDHVKEDEGDGEDEESMNLMERLKLMGIGVGIVFLIILVFIIQRCITLYCSCFFSKGASGKAENDAINSNSISTQKDNTVTQREGDASWEEWESDQDTSMKEKNESAGKRCDIESGVNKVSQSIHKHLNSSSTTQESHAGAKQPVGKSTPPQGSTDVDLFATIGIAASPSFKKVEPAKKTGVSPSSSRVSSVTSDIENSNNWAEEDLDDLAIDED